MKWWITILVMLLPAMMLILPRRLQMERRARSLLRENPNAERTSIYLALHSFWPKARMREIDAKIDEMKGMGWTFLRGVEASPFRAIRSLGGGLTLHFVRASHRVKVEETASRSAT
jgi:hypothetical protein